MAHDADRDAVAETVAVWTPPGRPELTDDAGGPVVTTMWRPAR